MIEIENTFAEAFPMKASRLIITALNINWAKKAAQSFCGFATSVIACGCEAGIESELSHKETPDGRPGVSILIFSMSSNELKKQILNFPDQPQGQTRLRPRKEARFWKRTQISILRKSVFPTPAYILGEVRQATLHRMWKPRPLGSRIWLEM